MILRARLWWSPVLTVAVLVALAATPVGAQAPETKTLWVGHYRVDCVGVGQQKCLLVREYEFDDWQLYYGRIEGFDFVEGYAYQLLVVEERIDNPPADGSSIRYKLIEVVDRLETMDPPPESAPKPGASAEVESAVAPRPPAPVTAPAPVEKASPKPVARAGEPAIRGIIRSGLGPETRSFQPCGASEESWVVDETNGELWSLYRKLTGGATRPMYVEI